MKNKASTASDFNKIWNWVYFPCSGVTLSAFHQATSHILWIDSRTAVSAQQVSLPHWHQAQAVNTALRVTHCQWQFCAFPSPCYSEQLSFISRGTVVIMFLSSCDTSAWTIAVFLPSRAVFLTWALWTPEPVCSRRWKCPRNRRSKYHWAQQASTSSTMGTVPCDHLQRAKV